MREIVLDTETTGLDPAAGHRVVEIAGVELVNHVATGRTYQTYINPERAMPEEAFRIHGLSDDFLARHRVFADVVDELLAFLGEDRLVIHNADFDLRFLNHELDRLGHPQIPTTRAVDTVALARERFPGAQVNLDALCKRFEIDNSARDLHGALLDCQLLAEVYLELCGGREPGLALAQQRTGATEAPTGPRAPRAPRSHAPGDGELARHAAMLEKLTKPIWRA